MFLLRDGEILLAMKKRGFGAGRWNGAGGKPIPGETIEQTAVREAKEEIGVEARSLGCVAKINFYFAERPEWNQQVHVFFAREWSGEPVESEEMAPRWFSLQELPFKEMWPDDIYWLPKVLERKFLSADFLFGPNDAVLDFSVRELADGRALNR